MKIVYLGVERNNTDGLICSTCKVSFEKLEKQVRHVLTFSSYDYTLSRYFRVSLAPARTSRGCTIKNVFTRGDWIQIFTSFYGKPSFSLLSRGKKGIVNLHFNFSKSKAK